MPSRGELKIGVWKYRKTDGAPVELNDLRVMHTEPIHLLIIDESLGDYHHEHPKPTSVPGEYVFTFTPRNPRNPGAYRVFADIVPIASKVQEYAVCDLPSETKGEPLKDRTETVESQVGKLGFFLQWNTPTPKIRSKDPIVASLTIVEDSTPFNKLEPVMGAYAHIVGFYEDRQTVLHIHPEGEEPQSADERGGPSFGFRFYAPKPGFIRLYVQVQIDGKQVFAPSGTLVAE